jgi:hypothetical protein
VFLELTVLDDHDRVAPPLEHRLRAVYPMLQCYFADATIGRHVTLLVSNTMLDPRVRAPATILL